MPKRGPFSTYATLRKDDRDPAAQAVYAEFARRLQARMQDLGWNQSELARRCSKLLPKADKGQKQNLDFGRDRISRYIRGQTLPRPESLPIIARALGCEESDLLPPLAVPTAPGERPAYRMEAVGAGRVALHINRTMTQETAFAMIKLLDKEDSKS